MSSSSLTRVVENRRRRRRNNLERAMVVYEPELRLPEWLHDHPGWRMVRKVRTSGKTAGIIDTFYISPDGRRFRSQVAVLHYIETGETTTPRQKQNKRDRSANAELVECSAPSSSTNTTDEPMDEGKLWIVPSLAKWTPWTPFIGDDMVPECVKQQWEEAFV